MKGSNKQRLYFGMSLDCCCGNCHFSSFELRLKQKFRRAKLVYEWVYAVGLSDSKFLERLLGDGLAKYEARIRKEIGEGVKSGV